MNIELRKVELWNKYCGSIAIDELKYYQNLLGYSRSHSSIFHILRAQNVHIVYDFYEISILYTKNKTRPDKELSI